MPSHTPNERRRRRKGGRVGPVSLAPSPARPPGVHPLPPETFDPSLRLEQSLAPEAPVPIPPAQVRAAARAQAEAGPGAVPAQVSPTAQSIDLNNLDPDQQQFVDQQRGIAQERAAPEIARLRREPGPNLIDRRNSAAIEDARKKGGAFALPPHLLKRFHNDPRFRAEFEAGSQPQRTSIPFDPAALEAAKGTSAEEAARNQREIERLGPERVDAIRKQFTDRRAARKESIAAALPARRARQDERRRANIEAGGSVGQLRRQDEQKLLQQQILQAQVAAAQGRSRGGADGFRPESTSRAEADVFTSTLEQTGSVEAARQAVEQFRQLRGPGVVGDQGQAQVAQLAKGLKIDLSSPEALKTFNTANDITRGMNAFVKALGAGVGPQGQPIDAKRFAIGRRDATIEATMRDLRKDFIPKLQKMPRETRIALAKQLRDQILASGVPLGPGLNPLRLFLRGTGTKSAEAILDTLDRIIGGAEVTRSQSKRSSARVSTPPPTVNQPQA